MAAILSLQRLVRIGLTAPRQGLVAHSTLRKPGPSLSVAAKAEIDAIADRQKKRLTELGL